MTGRWVPAAAAVLALTTVACAPMDDVGQPGQVTVPLAAAPPPTSPADNSPDDRSDIPDPTAGVPSMSDGPEASNDAGVPPTIERAPCGDYTSSEELPLRRCDRGDLVRALQGELAHALGIELAADGYFGNLTEDAVLRYQSAQDLDVDGIVGPAVWNRLFGSELVIEGGTRGISDGWFARPAADAVGALRAQGFLVTDYEVCSGTVASGQVRQIIGGDGTVYADEHGVTDAGAQLPIGSVIEVQVGSGTSC